MSGISKYYCMYTINLWEFFSIFKQKDIPGTNVFDMKIKQRRVLFFFYKAVKLRTYFGK
jgi:hypothetical protein